MAKRKDRTETKALEGSPTHLLHRVLQLALDYHAEAAGAEGLTQRQYAVLAAADGKAGLTQSELVRATGIDRSTLAELVARMETRGLIARARSVADARANSVHLTEAGAAALAAGAAPAAAADERLLSALPPKKRVSFVKLLSILADAPAGPDRADAGKSRKPDEKKARKKKAKKAARIAAGDPAEPA